VADGEEEEQRLSRRRAASAVLTEEFRGFELLEVVGSRHRRRILADPDRARRTRGRCGGLSVTGPSFMVGSAMRLALVSLVLLLATGVAANPDDDASTPGQPAAVTAESHFNQGQAPARPRDAAGPGHAHRGASRVR